jgi:hypothetical protein
MSALKKVIRVKNFISKHATGTAGTNILTLECGHEKFQKGSIRIPKRCTCRECLRGKK